MSAVLKQLRSACRRGELSDIAWHFAELLDRLDPSAGPSVLLAGALVSERTVAGDVCLRLADEAGRRLLTDTAEEEIVAPTLAEWRKALEHSESVGLPGEFRPLILEPDGRLYLYRYWEWEKRLAGDLLARAALADFEVDDTVVARAVDMFFPVQPEAMWQRVAAALAILRPFTV
ncbi:MAG: exodeoxyribonuclease V subunit alpha, partial [Pseudomonadota bacterium]|nr:exodeoxyribonuclease V subunit alpha [Pseudomonadota bacterium]